MVQLNETGAAEVYKQFSGPNTREMPNLVGEGREPISMAGVMGRCLAVVDAQYSDDVRNSWLNNYFDTGDSNRSYPDGSADVVLDDPALRALNLSTRLVDGAIALPLGERLEGSGVLNLSVSEVRQAQGQGYEKRRGVWRPANDVVGRIYEHFARDEVDPDSYAQEAGRRSGSSNVMGLYFGDKVEDAVSVRLWCLDDIGNSSYARGRNHLGNYSGRLVGVAPEALAHGNGGSVSSSVLREVVREVPAQYNKKGVSDYIAGLPPEDRKELLETALSGLSTDGLDTLADKARELYHQRLAKGEKFDPSVERFRRLDLD